MAAPKAIESPGTPCVYCGWKNPPQALTCRQCGKDLYAQGGATVTGPILLAGRYELLEVLGEGGMGAVYKAKDRELGRTVAVKIIRPEMASDPEILQRFKQELLMARKVTHKNVIRIYDLGDDNGTKFITMEYIDGPDLKTLLKEKGKFSPDEATDIVRQVCRALKAAHAEGVVHRDLKPRNIMVDKQGTVFVMDFGIAHSMEQSGLTRTGAVVGTPEYMSPEQARGHKIDHRSDLFSLGIILYEMLTGKSPFQADTTMGALLKVVQERPAPPIELDSSIPTRLNSVVVKCLEADPEIRYQDSREILQDLDARTHTGTTSVQYSSVSLPPRPLWQYRWLPRLRSPKWIAGAAALVLLAAMGAGWLHRSASRPKAKPKVAAVLVADIQNATGEPVFDGTLEQTLTTALEEASFINAYNRVAARRIAAKLQPGAPKLDEVVAQLVARREGIHYIVVGSISRESGGYRLSLRALDTFSGKSVTAEQIDGVSKQGVLSAVAKLTARIRNALGDDIPESLQVAAAETFTAGSLEAAHTYAVAHELERSGKWEEAIRVYLQAVELDPNLGRAYAGLAVANANLKRQAEAAEYYKKALAMLDRMSAREKYRTLGTYYGAFVRNYGQAIDTYRKLVEAFPADGAGYNNLGLAYVYARNIPEGIAASRHALEINQASLMYRFNLSLYSTYAGDFQTALAESRRVVKDNPGYEFAYLPLALSALATGDVKEARDTYARLEAASPRGRSWARMGLADLEMYHGRYREALKLLTAGIADDEKAKRSDEMAQKYLAVAEAHLVLKQMPDAVKAAARAAELVATETSLYPAARVLLLAGDDAKARKIALDLENMLQSQTRSYARLIEGEIALQRRQFAQAVDSFHEGQKLLDSWIVHYLLGRAYLEAGHFAEALAEFEICHKRRGEAADLMFDNTTTLRYLPPLYYWLGRAQEGMDTKDAARASYQQFLKLRAEAEAADPLLADARSRAEMK